MPVIDHMWQTETGGPVVRQSVRHRHAADQAGLGGDSAAGHRRGRGRRRTARRARPSEKGIMVLKRPFPGTDAGAVGRAGALRPRLLGEDSRRLLHRRLRARRRGRLRLVRGPRRRNHQDRRPPDRHDRSRERVPEASVGGGVRRHRTAGRDARRGHLGVRAAEARPRAVAGAARQSCWSTPSAANSGRSRSSAS